MYLADRPGRLVTKRELLDALWPGIAVTDGVLKVYVAEVRKALSDSPIEPRYIETVHGGGYRFIGPVQIEPEPASGRGALMLERDHELQQLAECLEQCSCGQQRIVAVTGEAGIGKTALVRTFAQEVRHRRKARLARGQCLETHGGDEPFFSLLEALSDLARVRDMNLPEMLRQHAPTWLAQLPSLQSRSDQELLRRENLGANQGRMVREFVELLCAATRDEPLVLILEDLQWSDSSTLDLIAHLARREVRGASLLVVGTFRPAELAANYSVQGVSRDLTSLDGFKRMPLAPLSRDAVLAYLDSRFPGNAFPARLAGMIRDRTAGNPLFVGSLVDYMVERGQIGAKRQGQEWAVEIGEGPFEVPGTVREAIQRQIDKCGEEPKRVLEAGSILGLEFSVQDLAVILEADAVQVQSVCLFLSRAWKVLEAVDKPDSVEHPPDRYRFAHELMLEAVHWGLDPAWRAQLHRRAAARLAQTAPSEYGDLARHFEGAMEWADAVRCLQLAAGKALGRYANREALSRVNRALGLVRWLPAQEQPAARASLQELSGLIQQRMDDIAGAAASFEELLGGARASGSKQLETRALLRLSSALFFADHDRCLQTAEMAVEASRHVSANGLTTFCRGLLAGSRIMILGWDDREFSHCATAVEQARSLNDPELLMRSLGQYCILQTYRSDYSAACRTADEVSGLALDLGDAYHRVVSQYFRAWSLVHLGKWGHAQDLLGECLATAERNENPLAIVLILSLLARMHVEAEDYDGARTIAGRMSSIAGAGIARYVALIAQLAAGDGTGLAGLAGDSGSGLRVDLLHSITLRHALSGLWLRRGDLPAARAEAIALVELAGRSAERTYSGLGRNMLAAIAVQEGDWQRAEEELALARCYATSELPLAGWRLFRSAAKCAHHRGRLVEAAEYYRRSETILLEVADTLSTGDSLRESLLGLAARA